MRKFIEDSGHQSVALIADGLIYISRTGNPVDPSDIVLGEFGIVKVTSKPVNGDPGEKPNALSESAIVRFRNEISRGSDSQEAMGISFDPDGRCLPNMITHLIPAAARDILDIARNRPCPYRIRDFLAMLFPIRWVGYRTWAQARISSYVRTTFLVLGFLFLRYFALYRAL